MQLPWRVSVNSGRYYSVTESEVNQLVKSNRLLNLGHNLEEAQAQDMAAAITVKRAMKEYGVKHALVFNRSIRAAKDFPRGAGHAELPRHRSVRH